MQLFFSRFSTPKVFYAQDVPGVPRKENFRFGFKKWFLDHRDEIFVTIANYLGKSYNKNIFRCCKFNNSQMFLNNTNQKIFCSFRESLFINRTYIHTAEIYTPISVPYLPIFKILRFKENKSLIKKSISLLVA